MNSIPKVLFISTFPPKQCGIASFSTDLIDAIRNCYSYSFNVIKCALDRRDNSHLYNSEEIDLFLDIDDMNTVYGILEIVKKDPLIKLVHIEHEFGLYGHLEGNCSLLYFLSNINLPFTIRFHTIINRPHKGAMHLINRICTMALRVLVMTKNSKHLLVNYYDVPNDKIELIPHGTHWVSKKDEMVIKKRLKLENKLVLSTFGFISQSKGLETGIEAMKHISKLYPEAIYLIIGIVHPVNDSFLVVRENYFLSLQELVKSLNLQNNVIFVNKHVETSELLEYLAITDIYLFTSAIQQQVMSGTFLYAMSAGCPIISTPFALASEMLDENTGIILKSRNSKEMSQNAIHLLKNRKLRKEMGNAAFLKTRDNLWNNVAFRHCELFINILGIKSVIKRMPDIKLDYFNYVISNDKTNGLISIKSIGKGFDFELYSKSVKVLLNLYLLSPTTKLLLSLEKCVFYLLRYISKINYQVTEELIKYKGIYKAIEVILDVSQFNGISQAVSVKSRESVLNFVLRPGNTSFFKNKASAIIAIHNYAFKSESKSFDLVFSKLCEETLLECNLYKDNEWEIIEKYSQPYELPLALLYAYTWNLNIEYKNVAEEYLNFLIRHTARLNFYQPLIDNSWNYSDMRTDMSGQTDEILSSIETFKIAQQVIGNPYYGEMAFFSFEWYLGRNRLSQAVYNAHTGACSKGLDIDKINSEFTIEDSVNYLLSRLALP